MAKKNLIRDDPPQPSSSEEDDSSEYESSDEQPKATPINSSATAPVPSKEAESESETESETDSDADSDPDSSTATPSISAFQLKPVAKSLASPSTPTTKRKTVEASPRKSSEDDIALLKEIIRYKSETGSDPSSDLAAFFDYVDNSNSVQTKVSSKAALGNKVRRLKKRYLDIVEKNESESENSDFVDLCVKIWGNPNEETPPSVVSGSKKRRRSEDVKEENGIQNGDVETTDDEEEDDEEEDDEEEDEEADTEVAMEDMQEKYPRVFASIEAEDLSNMGGLKEVCKMLICKVDESKLQDWESRWKKVRRLELEQVVIRGRLLGDQFHEMLGVFQKQ
ncbi:STOREKEEPER protein [Linum perenne]